MTPRAPPETPLAAVTHPNPYPFYAALVEERPLYLDAELGLWVASSARAVGAVLESARCRVRPVGEPVPTHLRESAAGFVFGRLVRMKDGPAHARLKRAVTSALCALEEGHLAARSRECAETLAEATLEPFTAAGLDRFVRELSVHLTASLLGLPWPSFESVTRAVEDYVRAVGTPGRESLADGDVGASTLFTLLGAQLDSPSRAGLLSQLLLEAGTTPNGRDLVLANAMGFLCQGYEATAGLLGNALLALSTHPEVAQSLRGTPALLGEVLAEVLRYDAPVQNTRRFVAESGDVGGVRMAEGDGILVVLAAANRDPSANANPHRFEPARKARRSFGFGAAAHLCPGQALSFACARAGLARLLRVGRQLAEVLHDVHYRPSANVRIPQFGTGGS